MMENRSLLNSALEALAGKWKLAIGAFLIYSLISAAIGSLKVPGSLLSLVLAGPLAFGAAVLSLAFARKREARIEQLFEGFRFFTNTMIAYLLMVLSVFLWMLLLIVPGIIAALSYSMVFYILADDPSLKAEDALRKSKAMMYGHKLKLFYLHLRFFLLSLLCILTLGIGFLWLIPLIHVTIAKFYDDIKDRHQDHRIK